MMMQSPLSLVQSPLTVRLGVQSDVASRLYTRMLVSKGVCFGSAEKAETWCCKGQSTDGYVKFLTCCVRYVARSYIHFFQFRSVLSLSFLIDNYVVLY
jgi:hypothetical protein